MRPIVPAVDGLKRFRDSIDDLLQANHHTHELEYVKVQNRQFHIINKNRAVLAFRRMWEKGVCNSACYS